ncbi:MAG: gliding motility-associated C-terminal domain-containing protein [Bacteroidetes bacterium]|nr:gliding motility-associated C-terminal domain-containing protein [Bacteroidota bacterium]
MTFLISTVGNAQILSTEGKDFWFGFMENHEVIDIFLEVYISAKDSTRGTIEIAGTSWNQEFSVSSDSTTRIVLPTNLAMANGSGLINKQAIHISSNDIVSVYALNNRSRSADVAVILPVTALGKEYFVTAHRELDGGGPSRFSEFIVVGIEDNTQISITPTATSLDGKASGIPFDITLNAGDVYQLQSSVGDLTGTSISSSNSLSCKNFAVFGGNEWTRVGQCGGQQDHLFEQMYPVSTWGRNHTLIPLRTRLGGDIYKFVAAEDNTEVFMDSALLGILQSGGYIQRLISGVHSITSNKPISVAQFSRSQQCDNIQGDPFMIMVSPNEQMLDRITFNALQVTVIESYYLNIVTKTSGLDLLILDTVAIADEFIEVPGNPELSFAQLEIEAGNHTLSSDSGFIAYVYGYGVIESFGYATGVSLKNLNLEVLPVNTSTKTLITSEGICRGLEVFFSVKADAELQFFEWDFGDGTTASGDSVTHVYDEEGDYFVQVEGFATDGSCASQQKASVQIPVIVPKVKILGPQSVCPNVTEIDYTIAGEEGDQYQWFVDGGTFGGNNTGDSVKINWGPTNNDALISILPTSANSCVGDTTNTKVKINVQLEPLIPLGADSLCSSDILDILYFTFFSNGSIYDWSISGGTFAQGDTTNSVIVNWDGPGTGSLWYEESSTLDSVCAGISDTLTVFIERAPDTVLTLISSKAVVQVGEEINFEIIGDSQFNFYNWDFSDGIITDSLAGITQMNHVFSCPGNYFVNVNAFTGTLCPQLGKTSKSITVLEPKIEMVNVTYLSDNMGTLVINWETSNTDNFTTDALIQRREVFPSETDWEQVGSTAILDHTYSEVPPDSAIYQYQLSANIGCQNIETLVHNNIFLMTTVDEDSETTLLAWNSYINWQNGVAQYEVWLEINDNDPELVGTTTSQSFEFLYRNDGFTYCFRIKAIENSGNQSFSWSSLACAEFSPKVQAYNVFTPNGDQYNPTLVFDGLELYPNNELQVLNRYGKLVFSATNYQNNWNGTLHGKLLPTGVYYFLLDLKEPRSDQQIVKGTLSILR